ncbi:hypothetical protein E2C01_031864 [Portunus trituberculatus]|uniref:Uncharacterized protein n=1 Tax=Portunus trituberculatus TaxID=210409 RepID=A0A5B7EY35_PORTR|nr:hypothetical protein [Portunus trituberculatus]
MKITVIVVTLTMAVRVMEVMVAVVARLAKRSDGEGDGVPSVKLISTRPTIVFLTGAVVLGEVAGAKKYLVANTSPYHERRRRCDGAATSCTSEPQHYFRPSHGLETRVRYIAYTRHRHAQKQVSVRSLKLRPLRDVIEEQGGGEDVRVAVSRPRGRTLQSFLKAKKKKHAGVREGAGKRGVLCRACWPGGEPHNNFPSITTAMTSDDHSRWVARSPSPTSLGPHARRSLDIQRINPGKLPREKLPRPGVVTLGIELVGGDGHLGGGDQRLDPLPLRGRERTGAKKEA